MLRSFVALLCFFFALPASAKLGETVPQLVKRFGKSYTVEPVELGKRYKFRSENVSVDAIVANGVSICEIYLSDHPLTGSGEPPNDIVRGVLRTNVPGVRWIEAEAAPFGADYALRSSDDKYIAILKYTGAQPENTVWTMTVGLAKPVRSLAVTSTAAQSPTAMPSPSPSPTAGMFDDLIPQSPSATSAADMFNAGHEYFVKKDYANAVKWFRKAAEQNYGPAQGMFGYCYSSGQGVPKDYAMAVKWTRKAAEQNVPVAQHNLGLAYANGQGVPKDIVEAVKWIRKAAEQNIAEAQAGLGMCYALGRGVVKDYLEAVKWFRKAAEQNVARAQANLAVSYFYGRGVVKDYVEVTSGGCSQPPKAMNPLTTWLRCSKAR
jgi:tetratricopeptide (TPR) repeat protein